VVVSDGPPTEKARSTTYRGRDNLQVLGGRVGEDASRDSDKGKGEEEGKLAQRQKSIVKNEAEASDYGCAKVPEP
jgi:hypothetical protein